MNKRVVKKNKQNKTKEERKKQIKVIYLYAYIESLKRTRKKFILTVSISFIFSYKKNIYRWILFSYILFHNLLIDLSCIFNYEIIVIALFTECCRSGEIDRLCSRVIKTFLRYINASCCIIWWCTYHLSWHRFDSRTKHFISSSHHKIPPIQTLDTN